MMHSYYIGQNRIEVFEDTQTVKITFPDGTHILSAPQDNDEYRKTALDLGYGNDTWAMCKEHDPFHIFIAVMNGKATSRALYRASLGKEPDDKDREEEFLVLSYQKH